jgi:magnesium-transporting ATPase (P-type)
MKIFGKSLPEYVSFEKGFLILILVVGLARLGLSLAGAPNAIVRFASMTVVLLLGLIYYSVRVHTSGLGSYKQLLPVLALPVILINLITVSAIVLAIETGKDNIFTAPEYSPRGANGKTWAHVAGHLIAIVVMPFVLWGVGALIMLVTKKLTAGRLPKTGTAGA